MRGHAPRRRNSSKMPAGLVDSTQYQLDFLGSVCDNSVKTGENDALTSPPPNHGKDGALPMTTSHLIPDRTTPVNPTPRRTYPQDWPSYNKAQTSEKNTLQILMADLCSVIPQPPHINGRPPLPLSDMVFASALKIYSGFSARRFNCDVEEANGRGHISTTPYFNSVLRYIQNPDLTPIIVDLIERSAAPLATVEKDFAVDATGFSTCRFARWFDHKWGKEMSQRQWIKAHAVVGVKTNIVTAIKITASNVNDTTAMPELLDTTSQRFTVSEISADKAYLSEKNLRHAERMGAKPFIPFKSNNTGKGSPMWRRLHAQFVFKEEYFKAHYHKRSNVETAFMMVKTKFGDSVKAKSDTGQVNEVLLKFLCHNVCVLIQEAHELGITSVFGAGAQEFRMAS